MAARGQQEQSRDAEIRAIHQKYAGFYQIGGMLTFVLIGVWLGALLFSDGYASDVYTEILGVVVLIVVLDRINLWRDNQRVRMRLKREAGSQSNEIARVALDWIRAEGWLSGENGLLKNASLDGANL
jgi:hypothetical protein